MVTCRVSFREVTFKEGLRLVKAAYLVTDYECGTVSRVTNIDRLLANTFMVVVAAVGYFVLLCATLVLT